MSLVLIDFVFKLSHNMCIKYMFISDPYHLGTNYMCCVMVRICISSIYIDMDLRSPSERWGGSSKWRLTKHVHVLQSFSSVQISFDIQGYNMNKVLTFPCICMI